MEHPIVIHYKKSEPYKNLKLYVTKAITPCEYTPAMIFFHGAGFTNNKVNTSQFQHHADHFSSLGITTILAEYRPLEIEGLFSPIESLKNAKCAIRYVRENNKELGIHPNKIIAVGASAGGYLCLCSAMIDQFNDPLDNLQISSKPDAMIIFNGGVRTDLLIDLFPELKPLLSVASPIDEVRKGLPPSIFFHGTLDKNIQINDIEDFTYIMTAKGNISRLVPFEGLGHGFFNYGNMDNIPYLKTIEDTEVFLKEIDLLL